MSATKRTRLHLSAHGVKVEGVELDLRTMMKRKDRIVATLAQGIEGLVKKQKVTRVRGTARLLGPGKVEVREENGELRELAARWIILATGSKVASLNGVEVDGETVVTSDQAIAFGKVPEHLVVIGAGAIGLELGSVWRRLGAKVTVLEYLDRILPGTDAEVANVAHKLLAKQGLEFGLGCRVNAVRRKKGKAVVECDGRDEITADRVLLAVGRAPNTDDLGLEAAGIELDRRGRIPVNEHLATALDGVYAIGDVVRGPMLAHKAEEEGVACVEHIVKGYGHVDYDTIPNVVYTEPEVAGVGKTEEELKEAGRAYRKGSFPFLANGRARALGSTDGMVKVLADAESDRVLGVHVVGPRAGDLIAEAAVAMSFHASAEDVAMACHAHPTLAEAIKEAALDVAKRALHK